MGDENPEVETSDMMERVHLCQQEITLDFHILCILF